MRPNFVLSGEISFDLHRFDALRSYGVSVRGTQKRSSHAFSDPLRFVAVSEIRGTDGAVRTLGGHAGRGAGGHTSTTSLLCADARGRRHSSVPNAASQQISTSVLCGPKPPPHTIEFECAAEPPSRTRHCFALPFAFACLPRASDRVSDGLGGFAPLNSEAHSYVCQSPFDQTNDTVSSAVCSVVDTNDVPPPLALMRCEEMCCAAALRAIEYKWTTKASSGPAASETSRAHSSSVPPLLLRIS
jgi:hypothetical protein